MSEALARVAIGEGAGGDVRVSSAGVATGGGSPATPEAVRAVASLGGDLSGHRSRALSESMIDEATSIFAMTRAHADRVIAMSPAARDRVDLLDPGGREIGDPIGGPQSLYDDVAREILGMVRARLTEVDG